MKMKKTLLWLAFWVGAAICFNFGVFIIEGKEQALEFLGGYVIEQSLSIDNLFLFIVIFSSFKIKPEYQRRILNYGIAGAIVLRLIFILLGIAVISMFHWILYLFGAILIISGVRMLYCGDACKDYTDSRIIKILGKIIPVTKQLEGDRFFVKKNHILYATPLFAVVLIIEFTDILFAVDSIPAVFSISTDAFIVYTSNMFALLGLRNMYFVLGKLHEKFRYVKYGVALILTFTGIKLVILMFDLHIPTVWSLAVIFIIMASSVVVSAIVPPKPALRNNEKLG
jgi:tellurite resistance protein TerC